ETASRGSGERPLRRGARPRAAGTVPRARGSQARPHDARGCRPLDVCGRRRPRIRGPEAERRLPPPPRAQLRGRVRARERRAARPRLAAGDDAAERGARTPRPLARAVGVRPRRCAPCRGMDLATPLGAAMNVDAKNAGTAQTATKAMSLISALFAISAALAFVFAAPT